MTEARDPWQTLAPGSVDARRVDPDGRYDFFWVVSGRAEPGVLLRIPPGVAETTPLPKMRNLDIGFQDIGGSRALVLILKDLEQRELFASLCLDIVRAAEAASDDADALQRAIRRTMRWHHLLRGGRNDLLSLEEQRGLVGELRFLRRLVDLLGLYPAIEAWKGPLGSAKDFELNGCLVEVKARRGAARPSVQISSEDQLSDVDGFRLFLVVSPVDAAIKPSGLTLTDHVLELERLYAAAEPDAYRLWELAITDTGFDFDDDYSDRRWTVGKSQEFEVQGEFPRVTAPLKPGVSSVRYSIALDVCAPFTVEPGVLDNVILGGVGEWTN
ncbi:PD-(D/E)XK motif protein [Sphingomonas sp. LY54]|uniref:PD-(D/E)XK motif protein n=1 Tax=Sphingomonas sp. LY54 TaxID=3095343 RepID=UPI002D77BAE2|nr:PD-(D/E)XK motif protein [Sphingomonas sp. LY54]WRP29774.1 PD-(D/E)XK motif protein [Sphingomonas sp. LY54]